MPSSVLDAVTYPINPGIVAYPGPTAAAGGAGAVTKATMLTSNAITGASASRRNLVLTLVRFGPVNVMGSSL
jgi:hypothetical protein